MAFRLCVRGLVHARTEADRRCFATKVTGFGSIDRTGARDDRRGRRKSPVAGAAAAARACAMARRPHIARGRSGTCASGRRARWRGAPFLPAARVPSSARACAHGAWRAGKEGDPPPPHFPHADVRACAARSRRRPASSDRARHLGVGPPRLSRPIARAPWDRTWRERAERRQLQLRSTCVRTSACCPG